MKKLIEKGVTEILFCSLWNQANAKDILSYFITCHDLSKDHFVNVYELEKKSSIFLKFVIFTKFATKKETMNVHAVNTKKIHFI